MLGLRCALRQNTLTISKIAIARKDGDIKNAGGAFSKKETAQEEQYFRKKQNEELKHLKEHPEELEAELNEIKKRKDEQKKSNK